MPKVEPGGMVSQYDNEAPRVRCLIAYPRTIEASFFSSRLREGLNDITEALVVLTARHNRNVAAQRFDGYSNF